MKLSHMKRAVSILMTLVLCMVFTVATTVPVNAASKKTYQVVTSEKTVSVYDGEKATYSFSYTYNKKGLMTKVTSKGAKAATKAIYKRNKKGYVTEIRYYNGKKLTGREVYKLKSNGDIKTATYYIVNGKKSKKDDTSTYTYWKKGRVKQIKVKGKDYTTIRKFDKKGHVTYYKYTSGSGDSKYTDITKSKIVYNKKGDPVKITENGTTTSGGETDTFKNVTTYKYTYNKKGNPIKRVATETFESGDYKDTTTETTTYKYKNVKVSKKYWRFFKRGSMTLKAL